MSLWYLLPWVTSHQAYANTALKLAYWVLYVSDTLGHNNRGLIEEDVASWAPRQEKGMSNFYASFGCV